MTGLVVFTLIDIVLLVAGLAVYLYWVGTLLTRIAGNLEECAEIVQTIVGHAKLIGPGVGHINETGGVVAGALPLLYGMAEEIVTDVTPFLVTRQIFAGAGKMGVEGEDVRHAPILLRIARAANAPVAKLACSR